MKPLFIIYVKPNPYIYQSMETTEFFFVDFMKKKFCIKDSYYMEKNLEEISIKKKKILMAFLQRRRRNL